MQDDKLLEIYDRVGTVLSTDEVEALKSDIVGAYKIQKESQPHCPINPSRQKNQNKKVLLIAPIQPPIIKQIFHNHRKKFLMK